MLRNMQLRNKLIDQGLIVPSTIAVRRSYGFDVTTLWNMGFVVAARVKAGQPLYQALEHSASKGDW